MRRTRLESRGWADRKPWQRIAAGVLYPVRLVVRLGLIGIAAASVAPLLADRLPPLATFESFRLHMAVASLPLAVLGLCFRPRWLAVLGLLAFAWNIATVWPYMPLHEAEAGLADGATADAGGDSAPHLKV